MIDPNKYRFNFLRAMKGQNLTQRDFSRVVNENESIISRIVNGTWIPDEARKTRYAKALGKKVKELFPEN